METITHTHSWHRETRQHVAADNTVTWTHHMQVRCSCGWKSKWNKDQNRSAKEARRHGMTGQTAFDV